ncbi:MAG TPA: hypothetical protein K8V19_00850 [Globicatella sulfidifaciens]|nr:hypothetical protein [Globicatella sulfidifaciens]
MIVDSFFNRLIYIMVFMIFGLLVRKAADKQITPWVRMLSRIIVLAVYAIAIISLLIFAILVGEVDLLKRILALIFASFILWHTLNTLRSFKK